MNKVPVVILNRNAEALGAPRSVPMEATRAWADGAIDDALKVAAAAELEIELLNLGVADQSPAGYHRVAPGVHECNGCDTATAALIVAALNEAARQEIEFWNSAEAD